MIEFLVFIGIVALLVHIAKGPTDNNDSDDAIVNNWNMKCSDCYYFNNYTKQCSLDKEPNTCNRYEDYYDDFYDEDDD